MSGAVFVAVGAGVSGLLIGLLAGRALGRHRRVRVSLEMDDERGATDRGH